MENAQSVLSPGEQQQRRLTSMMRKSSSTPNLHIDLEKATGSPTGAKDSVVKKRVWSRFFPGGHSPSSVTEADRPPAILSWRSLVVGLKGSPKILLNNLSGQITTGYWAIMG